MTTSTTHRLVSVTRKDRNANSIAEPSQHIVGSVVVTDDGLDDLGLEVVVPAELTAQLGELVEQSNQVRFLPCWRIEVHVDIDHRVGGNQLLGLGTSSAEHDSQCDSSSCDPESDHRAHGEWNQPSPVGATRPMRWHDGGGT